MAVYMIQLAMIIDTISKKCSYCLGLIAITIVRPQNRISINNDHRSHYHIKNKNKKHCKVQEFFTNTFEDIVLSF